jgi:hypothetical protein
MIHPWRCETCGKNCDWKGSHSDIGETVHEIMGKYGCASHSKAEAYLPLSKETWDLFSRFDIEKTPEQIVKEALLAYKEKK